MKKQGSITYGTDRANEVRYLLCGKANKVILICGLYHKLQTANQPIRACEITLPYNKTSFKVFASIGVLRGIFIYFFS